MNISYIFVTIALFVCHMCWCYRLPQNVHPLNYRLEIITYLGDADNKFAFSGNTTIEIICIEPTNIIVLHSQNLEILKESVIIKYSSNDEQVLIENIVFDLELDFLKILLGEYLETQHHYEIKIPYHAVLGDELVGYYRSSYIDQYSNTTHYLAVTQFEPAGARKAFPCFDEPEMKATFEITMAHSEKYSVISNMPIDERYTVPHMKGWKWTRFEESLPMSTYLVAFIVSDFDYDSTAELTQSYVGFTLWARKEVKNQLQFSKDIAPKLYDFIDNYFDVKIPLSKQDLVAVPDFENDGMENWGLITFSEAFLLYDPEICSLVIQQNIANVIAHELSHQWFGNLVTMKWWTDIWLNEGFATYMASLAVNYLFPTWDAINEESVDNLLDVFEIDSFEISHPVSVPVALRNEVNEIFDTISYKKGSYLLRMMASFLRHNTFKEGIANYLKIYQFKNAEQDDLWRCLTEQAHQSNDLPKNLSVKRIMDTWTLKSGYPVVKVSRLYGQNATVFHQERFLKDKIMTSECTEDCWWIPISFTNEKELNFRNIRPKFWLPCTNERQLVEGDKLDANKWLLVNLEAAGLFRVNYDIHNWKLLIAYLNSDNYENIPEMNRVLLIDDSAYLGWIGDLNYQVFFTLINYLKREDQFLPWKAALRNIEYLNHHLKEKSSYILFRKFVRSLLYPIYGKLAPSLSCDNTNQSYNVKQLAQIVRWACAFNVGNCVQNAKKKFDMYMKDSNNNIIPYDLQPVMFCIGVQNGGMEEWNFLWNKYVTSSSSIDKYIIIRALTCSQDIKILCKFLKKTIKPNSSIRKEDIGAILSSVAENELGFQVLKFFLTHHIEDIYNRAYPYTLILTKSLISITSEITTSKDYQWFLNLTESYHVFFAESKLQLLQGLENIKLNIKWRKRNSENIKNHLTITVQ